MEFIFVVLLVIGGAAWLVGRSAGDRSLPSRGTSRQQTSTPISPHRLPGTPVRVGSRGRVPVVGESHYQPAIVTVIAGRHVPSAGRWDDALEVEAALVPEPTNRFDPNAVRIDLAAGGGWVTAGHLSRDIAPDYQRSLLAMQRDGALPVVPARVCQSSGGPMAVYLHLSSPEALVFQNACPVDGTTLTARNSCAISGENKHQESLRRFSPSTGQAALVWATLHPALISSGKSAGTPTLEVRLDGERVGELTAAQVARYSHLLAAGHPAACEAEVYAGSRNLEMRVFLPSPE